MACFAAFFPCRNLLRQFFPHLEELLHIKTKTAERGSWLRTGIANCRTKFPAVFREIFENFRRILKFNYLVRVLSWNRVWETL
jgi:hypothetical protein